MKWINPFVCGFFLGLAILGENCRMVADSPTAMTESEKKLILKLQIEALWEDNTKRIELLGVLKDAESFRTREVAKVLVKRIYYESRLRAGDMPADKRWPVYGTLKAIGMAAVHPLVEDLKTISIRGKTIVEVVIEQQTNNTMRRGNIVQCLVDIYDQGGYGKEFARLRIEKELAKCSATERQNLQDALKDAAFKE